MIQSHVIDVDGVFVGAAVRLDTGYRFVATDFRLEQLDSTIWPTLADVRRLASNLFLTGRCNGLATSETLAIERPRPGNAPRRGNDPQPGNDPRLGNDPHLGNDPQPGNDH